MNEDSKWLAVGRVGRSKGLKGELYVDVFNPASETLFTVKKVRVLLTSKKVRELSIANVDKQMHRFVIRFDGVDNSDQADQLVGGEVYVLRSDLPELEEGEFYTTDLMGLIVETTDGDVLGEIHEVMATGSNDVYVVRSEFDEVLLPAIPDVDDGFVPAPMIGVNVPFAVGIIDHGFAFFFPLAFIRNRVNFF